MNNPNKGVASRAWVAALITALAIDGLVIIMAAPALRAPSDWLQFSWTLVLALMIGLPMIGIPAAMTIARTRAKGLALAVISAVAALYPVAVFGFFSFALGGVSAPVLLLPLALLLLVTASFGYRRLPRGLRHGGEWIFALLVVAGYLAAITATTKALELETAARIAAINVNDRAALQTLADIRDCAHAVRDSTGSYPATLAAMTAHGCLDPAQLADGEKGHGIEYIAGLTDADGRIAMFAATATPRRHRISGWQTGFVDDLGTAPAGAPADGPTTPAELLGMDADLARRIRWCALKAGASAGEYPVDLQALATADPDCLPWQPTGRVWHRTSGFQLSYLTEPVDGHQFFSVTLRAGGGDTPNRYVDSAGHSTNLAPFAPARWAAGPALRPPPSAAESAASTANSDELARGCAEGSPWHCLRLGRMSTIGVGEVPRDYERAAMYFETACNLELGEACRQLGTLLTVDLWRAASVDQRRGYRARARTLSLRACDLGDGAGCERAARDAMAEQNADGNLRALSLFLRGCELHHADACNFLAQIMLGREARFPEPLEPAMAASASARIHELCNDGDAGSCYLEAHLLMRSGAASVARRQATRLLLATCDAWPDFGCVDAAQLRLDLEGTPSPVTLEIAARGRCQPPLTALPICGFVKTDYRTRCDADDGHACYVLAVEFFGDDLNSRPPNPGWTLIDRACALGEAEACTARRGG